MMLRLRMMLLLGWCCLPVYSTDAEEPAAAFLQALRDRGYFDLTEAYLERIEQRGLASPEFRSMLIYERGLSAIQAASRESDPSVRSTGMEAAKALFSRFIMEQPDHPRGNDARSWLSRIVLEQARGLVIEASQAVDPAAAKSLFGEASQLFDEAEQEFAARLDDMRRELEEINRQPTARQDTGRRDELRNDYLAAKMVLAEIAYEKAACLRDSTPAYERQINEAAQRFGELAEKYRKKFVGLQALVLQGKCNQDLGNYKEARAYYEEFLDPSLAEGPLRKLAAQAVTYSMQCLANATADEWSAAVQLGESWLKGLGAAAAMDPDVQKVQLEVVRTLLNQSQQPRFRSEADRLTKAARKYALTVARKPGPQQPQARELLSQLPGDALDTAPLETPKTFEEAKLAADAARENAQAQEFALRLLERKVKTTQDANDQQQIRREVDESKRAIRNNSEQALALYRQAIRLAPRTLEVTELNQLRLYSAYLAFRLEDYYQSATVGEFLARKYPEFPSATAAANIALASYLRLYGDGSQASQAAFASAATVRVADYLAATWPTKKEAQNALVTLVSFMVQRGDVERARAYLDRIPADSPRRGEAELKTGQALWLSYRKTVGQNQSSDRAEAATLLEAAQGLLQAGIERLRDIGPTSLSVQAALSLAQTHVEIGQPTDALAWLNDTTCGPLTLLERNDPLLPTLPGFAAATYRTALRAQLTQMADPAAAPAAMTAVRQTMTSMSAAMGNSAEGRGRLVATYVTLANEMKEQMERVPPTAKPAVAEGFAIFLEEVAAASSQFEVLNWVAEAFFELGDSLPTPDGQSSPEARQYFAKASATYQRILDRGQQGELQIEPKYQTQIRMRIASTMSRLGAYGKAINEFEQVLRKRGNLLNVQVEAAQALQAGGSAGNPELLSQAINGCRRNENTGQNTIWGWAQIARVAQAQMRRSDEARGSFAPIFFTAQYGVAECRYLQALQSEDRKQKYLESAKRVIGFLRGSYPEMGGDEQFKKFDALYREIQTALGETPTGLTAARRVTPPSVGWYTGSGTRRSLAQRIDDLCGLSSSWSRICHAAA